ncbi:MAG: ATP-dependent Clp protease adaptor ClpS [bacterium]|nr:ATP-dependent Clp protease adaptor ClpS [bacterium]
MSDELPFDDLDTSAIDEVKKATPALFKVLMHNDNYSTMEFVVDILETIFHKSSTEANQIMLSVHLKGVGICGIYPFEIAETKADAVHKAAEGAGFPLRCSVEEV